MKKMKIILLFFLFTILSSCSDIDESDFIWTNDFGEDLLLSNIVLKEIKDSILIVERYPSGESETIYDSININTGKIKKSNRCKVDNLFGMGKMWRYLNIDSSYWDSSNLNNYIVYNSPNDFKYEFTLHIKLDPTRPLLILGDKYYLIFKSKKTGKLSDLKLDFRIDSFDDLIPYKEKYFIIAYESYSHYKGMKYNVSLIDIEKIIGE